MSSGYGFLKDRDAAAQASEVVSRFTPRERQTHALTDVMRERARQDEKWGGWPGVDRIDERYTAVLGEEFGEVCKAQLEDGELSDELRTELIQVAAVAVAWVEQIDALRNSGRVDERLAPMGGVRA